MNISYIYILYIQCIEKTSMAQVHLQMFSYGDLSGLDGPYPGSARLEKKQTGPSCDMSIYVSLIYILGLCYRSTSSLSL